MREQHRNLRVCETIGGIAKPMTNDICRTEQNAIPLTLAAPLFQIRYLPKSPGRVPSKYLRAAASDPTYRVSLLRSTFAMLVLCFASGAAAGAAFFAGGGGGAPSARQINLARDVCLQAALLPKPCTTAQRQLVLLLQSIYPSVRGRRFICVRKFTWSDCCLANIVDIFAADIGFNSVSRI